MRKLSFIAIAAAVLALAGCQSEKKGLDTMEPGLTTLTATSEFSTRSVLKADASAEAPSYSILWDAPDKILVGYPGVTPATFTSTNKSKAASATFKGKLPEGEGQLVGIYPAVKGNSCDADEVFSVNFLDEQTAVGGSYDPKAFPAVALGEDNNLQFLNVCGLLAIKVGYSNVTKISLIDGAWYDPAEGIDPSLAVSTRAAAFDYMPGGTLSVVIEDGVPVIDDWSEDISEIVLKAPSTGTFNKGETYYMAVPPCTLPYGATFLLERKSGSDVKITFSGEQGVERSKVHDVPTLYDELIPDDESGTDDPGTDDPTENDGTAAHPYTVDEALELIEDLGAYNKDDANTYIADVYVSGTIVSIKEVSPNYGNATYEIATDEDGSTIQVYRGRYIGNTYFIADDQIEIGDDVVVTGILGNYTDKDGNVTPEFMQNNYIYSLNGDSTMPEIVAYRLAVTTKPSKTTYTVGEKIDPSGMVVKAYKNDGTNEEVTDYDVSPVTLGTVGDAIEITVTWKGLSTTFTVKVLDTAATLGEYDTNISWKKGNACYDDNKLTVNGTANVDNLKFGTSSKFGDGSITLPAGTKKVTFYAIAWKGTPASLKFTAGSQEYTFDIADNSGATGNGPYEFTVTSSDKYTLTFDSSLASETDVKVETYSGNKTGKRAFIFGVQASD